MTKDISKNYLQIQGWMITDLNLKGNDLLIYALIYGFTQDKESEFNGSLEYIASWTNSTIQGIIKNINNLIEKKLIFKSYYIINNVKRCKYTTYFSTKQSLDTHSTKFSSDTQQSLVVDTKQSLDNNISNNTNNNIIKYGEFKNISLTQEEYNKLLVIYITKDNLLEAIEKLSNAIKSKGYKYKNYYAVLNKHNWVYKEIMKNNNKHTYTQTYKQVLPQDVKFDPNNNQ